MQFDVHLLNESEARSMRGWRYPAPYDLYNLSDDEETLAELLDRRSPYYAISTPEDAFIGFFGFGTCAQPWAHQESYLYNEDGSITMGLGIRPDLTSQGLGRSFVGTGLEFARTNFSPTAIQLFVLSFNTRAIHIYEQTGFQQIQVLQIHNQRGERTFIEMRHPG